MITKVVDFFSKQIPQNKSILIAVSGGPDSVALLHALFCCREHCSISRIGVAHVNHSLRGEESDKDELLVKEHACKLGVEFYSKKLTGVTAEDPGIEEWARRERYAFFATIKQQEMFDFVATAHSADDQAETILLRLLRGTGIRGLRGILSVREDGVIRPFLSVQRYEIIDWLIKNGIEYRIDQSNFDISFRRNWIRHRMLPYLHQKDAQTEDVLCATALRMQELWPQVREQINIWTTACVVKHNADSFSIAKSGLSDWFIASESIHELFDSFSITADAAHIDAIQENAHKNHGEYLLPDSWSYFPLRKRVLFSRRTERQQWCFPLSVPGHTEIVSQGVIFDSIQGVNPGRVPDDRLKAYLDFGNDIPDLVYRSIHDDDTFRPLGSDSETGLMDFLAKQKLSKKEREQTGVVAMKKGAVVWVPGFRINHKNRITLKSSRILIISCEKSVTCKD